MGSESGKYLELNDLGSKLIDELPEGARAFLLIRLAENLPLQELWRSGSKDKGTGGDGKRVLGSCVEQKSTVSIKDSADDPRMRGIKFRSFASALGVPILHQDRVVGAIFVASDKIDAFDQAQQSRIEIMVREYGPILSRLGKLTEDRPEPEPVPGAFLFSPAALVSVVVALLLGVIWFVAPSETAVVSPQPTPRFAISSTNAALDASQDFLNQLRAGEYDAAWAMLEPELQKRWGQEDFARAVSEWVQVGENKAILELRGFHQVQKDGPAVKALLLKTEVAGDDRDWVWELLRNDEGWTIASLDGPIKSP